MKSQLPLYKEGVTTIGRSAFSDCKNLQIIELSKGLTSIGNNVFDSCHKLQSIVIPDSVTEIGEYAFRLCWNLQSVVVPKTVTKIGFQALAFLPNPVTFDGTKEECEKIEGVKNCGAEDVKFNK